MATWVKLGLHVQASVLSVTAKAFIDHRIFTFEAAVSAREQEVRAGVQ